MKQSAAESHILKLGHDGCRGGGLLLFGEGEAAIDVSIDIGLVIPVVGQGGVDLAEGDVGILEVQFGGAPAVGQMGGDQFHDFEGGTGDVGNAVFAEGDVFVGGGDGGGGHGVSSGAHLLGISILAHLFRLFSRSITVFLN
jgi:hypothetical protein